MSAVVKHDLAAAIPVPQAHMLAHLMGWSETAAQQALMLGVAVVLVIGKTTPLEAAR